MISNEFAVKLCLDYEERLEKKVIKKELIVALRGEIYFVKFIINPEQDDVELCVIFGRSFMHLTQGIVNLGNETITIHSELDPFLEDSDDSGKSVDEWDLWLDKIDFGDIPELEGDDIPCNVCKMGKSNRNKRKLLERHESIYSDLSTSSSSGKPMTQEEATKQELALKICEKISLLEEVRPVIETMAYSDKYKTILDEICLDKMKLDGEISVEEEKVFYKIKGEALMEKDDPGAFIIPIRLEGNINLNALADTGSDINAEPMGLIKNVLCQIGVTTTIAKFLISDMPIDRDAQVLAGRGFLFTCGSILNTIERITSTYDGFCQQTFRAAKSSINAAESDSDHEEEYGIKRNKFGAPIYGPQPAKYLNCSDPLDRSIALQEVMNPFRKICVWKKATKGTHDHEAGSSRPKRSRQHESVEEAMLPQVNQQYFQWHGCTPAAKSGYNTRLGRLLPKLIYSQCIIDWGVLNQMGCGEEIEEMLTIRLTVEGTNEEIFTSEAWNRVFNINERIYSELCLEFYSTYEFDVVCTSEELNTKRIIKFRLCGRAFSWTMLEFAQRLGLYSSEEVEDDAFDFYFHGGLRSDENFNAREWMKKKGVGSQAESLVCCGQLNTRIARDAITLRELIDTDSRLIRQDAEPAAPRAAAPRKLRASMQDLYDGVFEHMARVYDITLQGAYNPPGYATVRSVLSAVLPIAAARATGAE
ncbi:hypothetical protein Tco_0972305 [Tanacetum coccineum]